MANITTMYYEDALKQNLMTQLKFKEIPSASSPTGSIFINDIQPVIVLEEPAGTIASEEKEEVVEKTPKNFSERFQETISKVDTKEQQIKVLEMRKKNLDKLRDELTAKKISEELGEKYNFTTAKKYIEVSRKNTMLYNTGNPNNFLQGGTYGMSTGNPRNSRNTLEFLDTYIQNYGQEYVRNLIEKEGWETMIDPVTGKRLIFLDINY